MGQEPAEEISAGWLAEEALGGGGCRIRSGEM